MKTMNIRDQIREDITKAISNFAFPIGNDLFRISKDDIEVNRPSDAKYGDFSTNVALRLYSSSESSETRRVEKSKSGSSRQARTIYESNQSPMEIANVLADSLKNLPYIEKLQAVHPGFVNFYLKDSVWQEQVKEVFELQSRFGSNKVGIGKKARVEYVSANPTGPLHFGNARGGPYGDVLSSVLEFSGYEVLREYYNNDVGVQIEKLGESIVQISAGGKLEDQEYKGEYVLDLAKEVESGPASLAKRGEKLKISSKGGSSNGGGSSNASEIGKWAIGKMLEENLLDCKAMGIKFDKVYSESEFIESGKTEEAIKFLEKKGVLKKNEGAVWFAPNDEFLRDRETVVVKSDGSYTYFANDIAYHRLKFSEGYDKVFDVIGANHHGHVPRLNAAVSALGFDVSKFKVILYQWVRFRKHGKPFSMSKRAGSFITAREVLDEIGSDALRFMLLMYDTNSPIDFDIDLARERSAKNPVYYVQYAHARICSILKNAGPVTKGSTSEVNQVDSLHTSEVSGAVEQKVNYTLLSTNYEHDLIKQITRLPELVEDIAKNFEVHHLTKYAMDLADSFHKFYENCRVIGEEKELMEARLALVEATKITLGNTFRLLGVSAPEKM